MPYTLSKSTRYLIAALCIIFLVFQLGFSTTLLVAHSYAHNGRISFQDKNWKDTVWFYEQANEWYPYNQHWWYSAGIAHTQLSDYQAGLAAMEQSLIRSPHFVLGLIRAATLKYRAKDIPVAEYLTQQAEAIVPHHWEVNYLQALLLSSAGNMSKATDQLLETRRDALEPQVGIESLLAYTAKESGRSDAALQAAIRLTQLEPDTPSHWLFKGNTLQQLNEPLRAIEAYEKTLETYDALTTASSSSQQTRTTLHREPLQAYIGLGEIYVQQKKYAKAVEAFYHNAERYADMGQAAQPIDVLAQQAHRANDQTRLQWACVLSAGRRWGAAQKIFETFNWGEDEKISSVARYHYALVLRNTGQLEEALTQFRSITTQAFTPSLAYAETLRAAGQPAAARFEYSKLLTFYDDSLTQKQRAEITGAIEQLTATTPE